MTLPFGPAAKLNDMFNRLNKQKNVTFFEKQDINTLTLSYYLERVKSQKLSATHHRCESDIAKRDLTPLKMKVVKFYESDRVFTISYQPCERAVRWSDNSVTKLNEPIGFIAKSTSRNLLSLHGLFMPMAAT